MAPRDLFIETIFDSIEYQGDNFGDFIELQVDADDEDNIQIYYYKIGVGELLPLDNMGQIIKYLMQNSGNLPLGYSTNFKCKVTFINHPDSPTSGWISVKQGGFPIHSTFNLFTINLNVNHAGLSAIIKINADVKIHVYPLPSHTFNYYTGYYAGPLSNFDDFVGCICDLLNDSGNLVDELKIKLDELLGKLKEAFYVADDSEPEVLTLNICEMAREIRQLIDSNLEHYRMVCDYLILKEAEVIFLEIVSLIRNIFWKKSGSEVSNFCQWDKFNQEVNTKNSLGKKIYLQACGAFSEFDATISCMEGIAGGIHLRWQTDELLKGRALSQGSSPFEGSRQNGKKIYDDSIKIYRKLYDNNSKIPTIWGNSNYGFQIKEQNSFNKEFRNGFNLNFNNTNAFLNAKRSRFPNIFDWFKVYNDYVEITFSKLCFAFEFNFEINKGSHVKLEVETISINHFTESEFLSSRELFDYNNTGSQTKRTVNYRNENENIKKIRFRFKDGGGLSIVDFEFVEFIYETYTDFYNTYPISTWDFIKKGVLSLNGEEVLNNRLKNSFVHIDRTWPRYKENVVLVDDNYIKQWHDTNVPNPHIKGIKELIVKYLNNEKVEIEEDSTEPGFEKNIFSQTPEDLLNLMATDFHVARMLGLGHIDRPPLAGYGNRYIYLAHYEVKYNLFQEEEIIKYMTLPTGEEDFRLPIEPEIKSGFGVKMDEGDCDENEYFDSNGYSTISKQRFVSLNREKLPYEKDFADFFQYNDLFNLGKSTMPTFFGIKYTDPNPNFPINAINNDDTLVLDDQKVLGGSYLPVRQTVPLINKSNPLFLHKQTENGTYKYQLYGINWFSRTSEMDSNEVTINTEFDNAIKYKLLPPSDIQLHYIQEEEALLLSTEKEQDDLAARTGDDKVWTRLCFNWSHVQKLSSKRFDKLIVYFRDTEPLLIKGEIKEVRILNKKECKIEIIDFVYHSSKNANTSNISDITPQNALGLVGSFFVASEKEYKILDVQFEGGNPVLKLKAYSVPSVSNIRDDVYEKKCDLSFPNKGEYFTIIENWIKINPNTGKPNDNWYQLSEDNEIQLIDLDINDANFETIENEQYFIGGIKVSNAAFEKYVPAESSNPEEKYDYSSPSFYIIKFNYTLPNQSNSRITWHNGILRIFDTVNSIYHDFEVATFKNESNNIEIGVFDLNDFFSGFSEGDLITINYHPGYKVYLAPETGFSSITGLPRRFNKENILPERGKRIKRTYISIQSVYQENNTTFYSELSTPLPLIALEERPVAIPEEPLGSLYATRPNFYKKSSYTFDTKLPNNNPYAFIMLRATGNEVLKRLYLPKTIENIKLELSKKEKAKYFNNFFTDLVNGDIFVGTNELKEYEENVFMAFAPDNIPALIPPNNVKDKKAILISALNDVFNPITSNPIIISFLKSGNQTRNTEPVIKDKNGNFLDASDPASGFDPFPFAVRCNYNGSDYLRFTDYKLDGDSEDIYFYSVCELGIKNEISERSIVLGPIKSINSIPPLAPEIKSILVNPGNIYLNQNVSVSLVLNKISDLTVNSVLLYRTFNEPDSLNYKKMNLVGTFSLSENILDDFNDLTKNNLPINEDCFYRVISQKTIVNEFGESELIDSTQSELFKVKLFDNENPKSPVITPSIEGSNQDKNTLIGVKFEFDCDIYKGKYYLFGINNSGNWQLINSISNPNNLGTLSFNLGNVIIKENDDWIYRQYKVVAENCSGLLSVEENILNLTSFYVPNPRIIGSKIACINQNKTYTVTKSKNSNVLQWRNGSTNEGTSESQVFNWTTLGNKTIRLTERDIESDISVFVTLTINVKAVPIPLINGPSEVWTETEINYTVGNTIGNFYLWELDGGEIINGIDSNSIDVKWSSIGTKQISVKESNGGCIVNSNQFIVNVHQEPNPQITGSVISSRFRKEVYELNFFEGNSISIGVDGGNYQMIDVNQLEVTWEIAGQGRVLLEESNNAGSKIFELNVDTTQLVENSILGNSNPQKGDQIEYRINYFVAQNNYEWEVSSEFAVIDNVNPDFITLTWINVGNTAIILKENDGSNVIYTKLIVEIS